MSFPLTRLPALVRSPPHAPPAHSPKRTALPQPRRRVDRRPLAAAHGRPRGRDARRARCHHGPAHGAESADGRCARRRGWGEDRGRCSGEWAGRGRGRGCGAVPARAAEEVVSGGRVRSSGAGQLTPACSLTATSTCAPYAQPPSSPSAPSARHTSATSSPCAASSRA